MGLIEGQVAVIAGANALGRGITTKFAREGASVVLIDRDVNALQDAGADPGIRAVEADLRDASVAAATLDAIAASANGIAILVNAHQPATPWADLEAKRAVDFSTVYEDVVLTAVNTMQAVFPHMRKQGGGRIINLGSMYGAAAHRGIVDAVVADGALAALTRGAGLEWARHQINVNFLQTAVPDIPAFNSFRAQHPGKVDELVDILAMGRMADPVEDVGGAALFLASDEGCFIVGHKVFADGGQHIGPPVFEPHGLF